MFERFTEEARAVVVGAQLHARRLGHGYPGCEHLLLALSSANGQIGLTLRGLGLTLGGRRSGHDVVGLVRHAKDTS